MGEYLLVLSAGESSQIFSRHLFNATSPWTYHQERQLSSGRRMVPLFSQSDLHDVILEAFPTMSRCTIHFNQMVLTTDSLAVSVFGDQPLPAQQ